ncbi:MAG: arsenate reductase [Bacteroidia bacterium]|jgi:arsenate reductase
MLNDLQHYIDGLDTGKIPVLRQQQLLQLAELINVAEVKQLNFICTHNSRRSQFAQIWGQTMANYSNKDIASYSGGIEVTECNYRTIEALKSIGFNVEVQGNNNPVYNVKFSADHPGVILFSKLYLDKVNPHYYIAIMTCDHADQSCPIIPEATERFSLTYTDPKHFDDSINESMEYLKTGRQIATEMKFLFTQLK